MWRSIATALVTVTLTATLGGVANAAPPRANDSWTVQATLRQRFVQLGDVSCPTATFCVVDGAAIVEQTSNGGRRWTSDPVQSSYSVFRVSCAAAFVCRGVGSFDGNDYQKFVTETSRSKWVPSSVIEDEIEPTSIEAISCPTSVRCIAVGANNLIGGNSSGFPYWVSTTQSSEAGSLSSWRRSLIRLRPGSVVVGLTSVDCPTPSVCFALSQLSDDGVVVLKTTTSAAQWFTSSIKNTQPVSHDDALTARFSDLSCATEASCAVAGVSANGHLVIASTSNGGTTWHWSVESGPPKPLPGQAEYSPTVSCAGANTCVVTDGRRLLYSGDGGSAWASFPEPTHDGLISSLDCPTSDQCFVTTALPLSAKLQSEGWGSGDIVLWRRYGRELWPREPNKDNSSIVAHL